MTTSPRLFDAPDNRRAGRVERIYQHLMDNRYEITSKEHQHLLKLNRAFAILSEQTINHNKAVKLIRELEGCSKLEAMTLIRDSEDLYARIRKINKETQRILLYDQVTREMEIAQRMGNRELVLKCVDRLIKIGQLDKDDVDTFDITDLRMPTQILYTDDPEALYDDAEILDDEEE